MEAAKYVDVLLSLSVVLLLLYGLAWLGKKLGLVERFAHEGKSGSECRGSDKVVLKCSSKKPLLRFALLGMKVRQNAVQPDEKQRSRVQTMILDAQHKLLSFEFNGQHHAVVSGPTGIVVLENTIISKKPSNKTDLKINNSSENSSSMRPVGEILAPLIPPSWVEPAGMKFADDFDNNDDDDGAPPSTTLQ